MLNVVIMAGGRGERFWPLSREECPKQLLRFDGEKSLLQRTVDRVLPLTGTDGVYIVTSEHLRDKVIEQLPHIPPQNILTEPIGKNTAPCIALAAGHLRARGGKDDAVMAVLPADHAIFDDETFRQTLMHAYHLVQSPMYRDSLVTIGIEPTRPETGYGYIRIGAGRAFRDVKFYEVQGFVEKPNRERAESYLRSGDYFWNSGMFVWRLGTIQKALADYLPEVAQAMERIQSAVDTKDYERVLKQTYSAMPSISIDYGVMEKADQILCVPASFGWDDVGSWSALGRLLPADRDGNVVRGAHVSVDTKGCVVYSHTDRLVATVGLQDVVIVDTDDALLICHKDSVQQVRDVVAALRKDRRYRHILRSANRMTFKPAVALQQAQ